MALVVRPGFEPRTSCTVSKIGTTTPLSRLKFFIPVTSNEASSIILSNPLLKRINPNVFLPTAILSNFLKSMDKVAKVDSPTYRVVAQINFITCSTSNKVYPQNDRHTYTHTHTQTLLFYLNRFMQSPCRVKPGQQ